jgi:hypothetical protein
MKLGFRLALDVLAVVAHRVNVAAEPGSNEQ